MIYILAMGAGVAGALSGWTFGIVAATAAGIDISSNADVTDRLTALAIGPASAAIGLLAAVAMTLYLKDGVRSLRELATKTVIVVVMTGILAAGSFSLRASALTHLGINAAAPAVEFEIRLPPSVASEAARNEAQVELLTDRNQTLALLSEKMDAMSDGRSVLRGHVPLEFRTADRVVVLSLPGQAQRAFRLRLAADPSPSDEFGPWHLPDRVVAGGQTSATPKTPDDSYAIRYRVL